MPPPFTVSSTSLTQVDGSARLSAGNTSLIASVTGPIEAKLRHELPTQASLEIIVRPATGVSATREKFMEDYLRLVLQLVIVRFKYPRQLIQIVVQFLTSDSDAEGLDAVDGGASCGKYYTTNELCAAINCLYFALVDAKVALYESFAAVSLATSNSGVLDVFPSLKLLQDSRSHHVVALGIRDARASKILLVDSHGSFSEDELVQVIEKASSVCEKIHKRIQRPAIEKDVASDYIWQSED